MKKLNSIICASGKQGINDIKFEIVERKGVGHPDTLCDTIAEKISQAYSKYCLEKYGKILRHMVDKIALSGGSSKVKFGGGEMEKPIKLYLNCRFTRSYNNEEIPYLKIVKDVVYKHFSEVLPLLDLSKWLLIVDNTHDSPGPGVVYEEDGSTKNERQFFFSVPDEEFAVFHNNDLRSNDTSTVVAYSPLSTTEEIVILVEKTLNSPNFKKMYPYVGTDIKVMAKRVKKNIELTVCIPFVSLYTPNKEFYLKKIKFLKQKIKQIIGVSFNKNRISININTRDNPEKDDYYLTITGSAIESGDEGVVGRGNRHNGVISFSRHMSMEACCGKNPVYHVGKIYTAISFLISKEIFKLTGLENYVYITSQMGRHLSDPWLIGIDIKTEILSPCNKKAINKIIKGNLSKISDITKNIIDGELNLF